jgi:hypothetical protein
MDAVEERKILHCRELNSGLPARSPSLYRLSYPGSSLSKNVKIKTYNTIILPAILYGCETWSLTLREEHRENAFENGVMRRIFGPKRNEIIRG